MATNHVNRLASYDLTTEDGFREFVREAQRQFRDLHDVLAMAAETLSRRLENTPTHGDPTANSRKEAGAIRRRFLAASVTMTFATRSLLQAFKIFEAKFVPKPSARPGMKMTSQQQTRAA